MGKATDRIEEAQNIKVNPKIVTNIIVAIAAVFALLLWVGQFVFKSDKIQEPGFWINQVIVGVIMAALYYSVVNIFYERLKIDVKYINVMERYAGRLNAVTKLADLKTVEAINNKVDDLNKQAEHEAKLKILSKAVPSVYCEELKIFTKSFESFNNCTDDFWNGYFEKYKISKKRKKAILIAVKKIRENDFKFKKLRSETILIDNEIQQKMSDTFNIEFYYDKEVVRGVFWKFVSFLLTGALFASLFIGDGQIPFWEMFIAVVTRIFMIVWSISLGVNKSVSIISKRKSAVRARCFIMDEAMVLKGIFPQFKTELKDTL